MPRTASKVSILVLASLFAQQALPGQEVRKKELDTLIPYLRTIGYGFSATVYTAAPTESIPAPVPNPNNLADTAQLAYALWRTDQTAVGAAAHSAPHTLKFARTTDGGKTWSTRTIFTSAALASGNSYTTTSLIDFHLGAEGNTVFVSFVSGIPGQQSAVNVYLMGSEDQGQTWSAPILANKVTAPLGSSIVWANESELSVTRDPGSTNVRAHLAYEFGDTTIVHPSYQGKEAPHHTAYEFVNGTLTDVVQERDISNVPTGQNTDIDNLALLAKGGAVLVMWRSDRNTYRGSGTSFNQLFGTYSTDGGKTFAKEMLLGDTRPPLGSGNLDPKINGTTGSSIDAASDFGLAIDGPRFYFLWADRSHNFGPPVDVIANERVFLYYTTALGLPGTWNRTEVTPYKAGRADIDTIDIAAENGRVVIAVTSDERGRHKVVTQCGGTLTNSPADQSVAGDNQGSGNHTNQIQVFTSEDGGKTFADRWVSMNSIDDGSVLATQGLTGVVANSRATLKGTNFINCKGCMIEMRGDVCHLVYEQEWYGGHSVHQGEDLIMWISLDGGKTWVQRVNATAGGAEAKGLAAAQRDNSDIDSPFLTMTPAGTAVVGFRLEAASGASGDRPQVFIRPAPLSADVTKISLAQGGTQLQALDVGAAHQGRSYLVGGSVTGSKPGFDIGGVHVPLQYDPWTDLTLALANSPALPNSRGVLDANGRAVPGLVVPKGLTDPTLIGLNIYSAALIFDASGFHFGTNAGVVQLIK